MTPRYRFGDIRIESENWKSVETMLKDKNNKTCAVFIQHLNFIYWKNHLSVRIIGMKNPHCWWITHSMIIICIKCFKNVIRA